MAEEVSPLFEWFRKDSQICYRDLSEGTDSDPFCGHEEVCRDAGMALPLFNESMWDWRFRAVLYLIGLLYR